MNRALLLSAALIALAPMAACSTDGRTSFSAGGATGASAPGDSDGGSSGSGSGSGSGSASVEGDGTLGRVTGQGAAGGALASAGNAGDLVNDSGVIEAGDDTIDPMARVSVAGETVVGNDGTGTTQAIGLSAASETQNAGQVATVGVLANGQVTTASLSSDETNLADNGAIGLAAGEDQVIGENGDPIAGSIASPSNAQGTIAGVNALSGDQIANVQVNGQGATTGGLVDQVTTTIGGLTGN